MGSGCVRGIGSECTGSVGIRRSRHAKKAAGCNGDDGIHKEV